MTTPDQTRPYIPLSALFPDIHNDFETFKSLLQGLSLTDTLFWCARLNLVISNPDADHIMGQEFALKQFLTADQINSINNFARRNGGAQKNIVFFRGQLLELVRWVVLYCHDHPGDGTTFDDPEVRQKFVQAALIASDVWAKRVFGSRLSMNGGVSVARKRALGPFRKSIEATLSAPDLSRSLGRGWTLFEDYFPRSYQPFEDAFMSSTGLSIEEYYI